PNAQRTQCRGDEPEQPALPAPAAGRSHPAPVGTPAAGGGTFLPPMSALARAAPIRALLQPVQRPPASAAPGAAAWRQRASANGHRPAKRQPTKAPERAGTPPKIVVRRSRAALSSGMQPSRPTV